MILILRVRDNPTLEPIPVEVSDALWNDVIALSQATGREVDDIMADAISAFLDEFEKLPAAEQERKLREFLIRPIR